MFKRPNWKDESAYQWLLRPDCNTLQIAWEFLRRNQEYGDAVAHFWTTKAGISADCFDDYLTENGLQLDEADRQQWLQNYQSQWRIGAPEPTDADDGWLAFPLPSVDEEHTFQALKNGAVVGPRILLPVDLSEPLERTFERLQAEIRELRDRGIRSGVVVPKNTRKVAPALYVQYLRILDATAAGAGYEEIGATLTPDAINDPDDRQRDKRTRAAHAAASKLQDLGYRELLDESDKLLKI